MSYLLDTDWVINALAGKREAASVIERLAPRRLAISLVSVAEIYEGAFNSPNPQAHFHSFRVFLRPFRKLVITDPIAERFAEVRALLRRRGQLIPDFDILLAATALDHDLTVLTFNRRHFQRVPDLRVYRAK